ncbi:MAG: hypothetical protein NWS20_05855, partial [Rickettsiaceae bacterium]|nr:hypothetical protein [Rickettsiaceae bacterium]
MSKVLIKEMREAVLCASNTSQAYNILSNIVAIEKRGEVFKIHLRNLKPISELGTFKDLAQHTVNFVYRKL